MEYYRHLKDYTDRVCVTLKSSPFGMLERAAKEFLRARREDRWIFSAGNGGSAATASHFANDFVKGLSIEGKKRFKCMALCDGVPILTALSNDYDYSLCYTEQLKNYGSAGDIFVAYSGSGNSPNVVNAAEYARGIGMKVVSFTGRDGGRLHALSDIGCIAATDCMEEIEDVHMLWEHALVTGIRKIIEKEDV